jgi:hypothetical protein
VTAEPSPGLCAACRHARSIVSSGAKTFYQCLRAELEPAYPKWPRLPVLSCPGYEPGEGESLT